MRVVVIKPTIRKKIIIMSSAPKRILVELTDGSASFLLPYSDLYLVSLADATLQLSFAHAGVEGKMVFRVSGIALNYLVGHTCVQHYRTTFGFLHTFITHCH